MSAIDDLIEAWASGSAKARDVEKTPHADALNGYIQEKAEKAREELAELRRLADRAPELRAIVEWVADPKQGPLALDRDGDHACADCGNYSRDAATLKHDSDCIVTRARAALEKP